MFNATTRRAVLLDRPRAEKLAADLAAAGIRPEGWGGDGEVRALQESLAAERRRSEQLLNLAIQTAEAELRMREARDAQAS